MPTLAFRPRAAYAHSAETSIYVRKDLRSRGLGRRMYEALAKLLLLQNVFNMEACIAHCDPADEYVPATSRLFHTRLGFEHAGRFNKCALKFGRWYDMIWMERILAKPAAQETSPFRPLPDIDQPYIDSILSRANHPFHFTDYEGALCSLFLRQKTRRLSFAWQRKVPRASEALRGTMGPAAPPSMVRCHACAGCRCIRCEAQYPLAGERCPSAR